jgi:CHAT domain-containing protein
MPNRLKKLAEILNLEEILQHLKGINRLILIPHRDLHLLPLDALFPDNFTIKYLPSIKAGLDRKKPTENTSLLSVENPREDLRFASLESDFICKLYPKAHRIAESVATKAAVKTALSKGFGILNFTGHGKHDVNQPAQSALLLANQETLTLKDILELDLSHFNLVCLSGCKTNFTSKFGLIDEFVGLASGFVAVGANNVIGSLWTVDDLATAYLMTKFHEIWRNADTSDVASALKAAQNWLRNATKEELDRFPIEISQSRDVRTSFKETVEEKSADDKPYQSPYYWAGFCAIGL